MKKLQKKKIETERTGTNQQFNAGDNMSDCIGTINTGAPTDGDTLSIKSFRPSDALAGWSSSLVEHKEFNKLNDKLDALIQALGKKEKVEEILKVKEIVEELGK